MLSDLQEVKEIRKDSQYIENRELLLRKLIGEKVLNHNLQILSVLENDPNRNLYDLINGYLKDSEGSKVGLEDMETYINAHIHDLDGQEVSVIGISTNPNDKTTESVTSETYHDLKSYLTDYEVLESDINSQLDRNTI